MTEQELADLNAELLPFNQCVRTQDEGATYQLCNLVPVQILDDPVAFALLYGIVVVA